MSGEEPITFEEQLSSLSDTELLAVIATLSKCTKQLENNLKLAKKNTRDTTTPEQEKTYD